MTHQGSGTIIHFASPIDSAKPNGVKVYHCAIGILVLGVLIGALIF